MINLERVRAHVFIEGKVQAVNFRAACRDQARQLNVGGWVRNLPDGRVEAIFEGQRAPVQRMVSWCYSGPSHASVERVTVTWEDPVGQEPPFAIMW